MAKYAKDTNGSVSDETSKIRQLLHRLSQRGGEVEQQKDALGFAPIAGILPFFQMQRLRRVLENILRAENGTFDETLTLGVRDLDNELRSFLNTITDTIRDLEQRAEAAEENLALLCEEDAKASGTPAEQAKELAGARVFQQQMRVGWVRISAQVLRVTDPIQGFLNDVRSFSSSMVDGLERNVEEVSEVGIQKRDGTLRAQFAELYRTHWAMFDTTEVRLDLSSSALDAARTAMDRYRQEVKAFEEMLAEIDAAFLEHRTALDQHTQALKPIQTAVGAMTRTVQDCRVDPSFITVEKHALREAGELLSMAKKQLGEISELLENAARKVQITRATLDVEIKQKIDAIAERLRTHRVNVTQTFEGDVRERKGVKALVLLFFLQGKTKQKESRGISKAVDHLVARGVIPAGPFAARVVEIASASPLFRQAMKYTHVLTELGIAYADKWSRELDETEWKRFQDLVCEEHAEHVKEKAETKERNKSQAVKIIEPLSPLQQKILEACAAWSDDIDRFGGISWYELTTAIIASDDTLREMETVVPALIAAMTGLLQHQPVLMVPERIGKARHPGYALTPEGKTIIRYFERTMTPERQQAFHAFRSQKLNDDAMVVVGDIGLSTGRGPGHT